MYIDDGQHSCGVDALFERIRPAPEDRIHVPDGMFLAGCKPNKLKIYHMDCSHIVNCTLHIMYYISKRQK